jgi:hypothetical protein
MDYNTLLAYLSELGSGNWSTFRAALDFLAVDEEELYPSVKARHLSTLGHVEFSFFGDLKWTVCPPTLAWLPYRDKLVATLCGGRTQRLVDTVFSKTSELGLQIEVRKQAEGPDAIFVATPSRRIGENLAEAVGLASEHDAAKRIARCLPSLDGYLELCVESPEPSGYTIRAFDTDALDWVEVRQAASDGLYRYEYYRPEYRLKTEGRCLRTSRESGIYLLLGRMRRSVLHYDRDEKKLSVPVRAPMPVLFARAATLSSGLLPRFLWNEKVPTRVYRAIPEEIADWILSRLGQEVEAHS